MTPLHPLRCANLLDFCHVVRGSSRCLQGLLNHYPLPTRFARTGKLCKQVGSGILFSGYVDYSNTSNDSFRIWTYSRYAAIWGSLAWYSPVTWLVTNKESPFANNPFAPISLANNVPAIRASYSAWLLLALKENRRACSISNPSGPSKMTPAPLSCWF